MYLFDTDVLSNIVKRKPSQILLQKLGKLPKQLQFTSAINIGEIYYDSNGNGQYDASEEFLDSDSDNVFDPAETFTDTNGNDRYDYGIEAVVPCPQRLTTSNG